MDGRLLLFALAYIETWKVHQRTRQLYYRTTWNKQFNLSCSERGHKSHQ